MNEATAGTAPQALPDFDLVLFGGTGDLAMRKLLPGLYRRHASGDMPAGARIIALARSAMSRDEFIAQAGQSCRKRVGEAFDAAIWDEFASRLSYLRVDATAKSDYAALSSLLAPRADVVRVFFLSTAPSLFEVVCRELQAAGVVTPSSRIVLEKPLGSDTASASRINDVVGAVFAEHQIFRIDHYLGKETVQNLLALRFGNALFEPLWRRGRIRHVQITVAEQLGVGTRADFYDRTGALRDMVQNHLLQLLCIIAMEPPVAATGDAVRDEKLKVLRALRPMAGADALRNSVRGQYRSGVIGTGAVPGYLDEAGVEPDSVTESFVALRVDIDSWRWAGVPFYLRTGKRLPDTLAEIVVTFEQMPHSIFDGAASSQSPNRLVIRLQPEEHITLRIMAKRPGEAMRLKPVDLGLDLTDSFKSRRLDAYERLLGDAIQGNLTLFMRRDEVDAAWRWIDPIRAAWDADLDGPRPYVAGSWGPSTAASLIARDGYEWHEEI
ncbi:MAG: glucose-6-phosphate dehydrogenase [Gammaproteobacteria bacterium]|nr:glucose-6-phosphate dehydrogenase [Gammaproteobacteria bacterium]MDH5226550.1 glucose-6-phosphate dehydrogenase [Gammaproteobacteria bacterium]